MIVLTFSLYHLSLLLDYLPVNHITNSLVCAFVDPVEVVDRHDSSQQKNGIASTSHNFINIELLLGYLNSLMLKPPC